MVSKSTHGYVKEVHTNRRRKYILTDTESMNEYVQKAHRDGDRKHTEIGKKRTQK
jgi:hypothetical protein